MYRVIWLTRNNKAVPEIENAWHTAREAAERWARFFASRGHRVSVQTRGDDPNRTFTPWSSVPVK